MQIIKISFFLNEKENPYQLWSFNLHVYHTAVAEKAYQKKGKYEILIFARHWKCALISFRVEGIRPKNEGVIYSEL